MHRTHIHSFFEIFHGLKGGHTLGYCFWLVDLLYCIVALGRADIAGVAHHQRGEIRLNKALATTAEELS